jgi:hypothetical protein
MKSFILYYLIAGIIFNLIWDLMTTWIAKEEIRLDVSERIFHLIVWPITTIMFLYALTKSFINQIRGNDKD